MCATCGCSNGSQITITNLQTGQHEHLAANGLIHAHGHDHFLARSHTHAADLPVINLDEIAPGGQLQLERDILSKNDRLAEQNRRWLTERKIRAINLMSSPGAGKTTLLERTIRTLGSVLDICVVEGDQETARDGERIRAAGARAIQINTGAACHLDAAMVSRALQQLDPHRNSVVMIENVGNLVCPAMFDLGEHAKIVVASVTEGADKPAKYPHMFRAADVIVLNKIDLLPYVDFDIGTFLRTATNLRPNVRIFQLSTTRGDGLDSWFEWVRAGMVNAII
jgi:hydrogenase nickel incorporation protein HypB